MRKVKDALIEAAVADSTAWEEDAKPKSTRRPVVRMVRETGRYIVKAHEAVVDVPDFIGLAQRLAEKSGLVVAVKESKAGTVIRFDTEESARPAVVARVTREDTRRLKALVAATGLTAEDLLGRAAEHVERDAIFHSPEETIVNTEAVELADVLG